MISGINASLAALFTFGNQLSNSAGNIANVNTDGYKEMVATIKDDSAGLPQVCLKTSGAPGALLQEGGVVRESSNVDLAQEIPQMMISQAGALDDALDAGAVGVEAVAELERRDCAATPSRKNG